MRFLEAAYFTNVNQPTCLVGEGTGSPRQGNVSAIASLQSQSAGVYHSTVCILSERVGIVVVNAYGVSADPQHS